MNSTHCRAGHPRDKGFLPGFLCPRCDALGWYLHANGGVASRRAAEEAHQSKLRQDRREARKVFLRRKEPQPGFIYAVLLQDSGNIKVGRACGDAEKAHRRATAGLTYHSGVDVVGMWPVPDVVAAERKVHHALQTRTKLHIVRELYDGTNQADGLLISNLIQHTLDPRFLSEMSEKWACECFPGLQEAP